MKEEKKSIERTKTITIKGSEFVFDIADVSVNDYIGITNEKIRITPNYAKIATSPLMSAFNSANIIDMIATFRILKPEIEDAVHGKDFSQLNILDIKDLLDVYVKEFSPWYSSWMKEFESPFVPKEEKEGDKDEKEK